MTSEFESTIETIEYSDPEVFDELSDYLESLYKQFPEEFIDSSIDTLIENWESLHLEEG